MEWIVEPLLALTRYQAGLESATARTDRPARRVARASSGDEGCSRAAWADDQLHSARRTLGGRGTARCSPAGGQSSGKRGWRTRRVDRRQRGPQRRRGVAVVNPAPHLAAVDMPQARRAFSASARETAVRTPGWACRLRPRSPRCCGSRSTPRCAMMAAWWRRWTNSGCWTLRPSREWPGA